MHHFCFFSYEIFPFTRGGVGTYIASISVRLVALGHKVTLVLDIDEETFNHCLESTRNQSTESSRLKFMRLSSIVTQEAAPRENFPSEAHWKSYLFSKAVESIHKQEPIDILEFVDYCGPAYYTLIKRAAAPHTMPKNIFVRLHITIEMIDKCASSNFSQSRIYDYWLERTAITLADRILSPGYRYWKDFAAKLYNVPSERVIISPPCRSLLPRIADGISGENIVFVGKVSSAKGMDLFLQAMSIICTDKTLVEQFKQIRVIGPSDTVSDQDEEAILSYKIGIPQDKIQFLGNLSESDLINELSRAKLAVFPSRCDSYCYAAHEAHMVGVPLILSTIPAFLDHFVEGESALFFDWTVNDLISQIGKLLCDTNLRCRLSSSVLQHRSRYEKVIYSNELDNEADRSSSLPAVHVASSHLPSWTENTPSPATTVIFFCHKYSPTDATHYIKQLGLKNSFVDVIILIKSEGHSTIQVFGHKWEVASEGRSAIDFLRAGFVLLLSDSFTLAPSFIERAQRIMVRMPAVGAILPVSTNGRWGGTAEFGRASDLFNVQLGILPQGFPLLIRLINQTPLQRLLHDRSSYTVLTLLIELRAAGYVIIDDIHPTQSRNVESLDLVLPGRKEVSAFIKQNHSRYRDYELAGRIVDEVQKTSLLNNSAEDSNGTVWHILQDLHHGLDDVLYMHVTAGIVSVFSIINPVTGREINWQDMELYGKYEIIEAKDRPIGFLQLTEGCRLRINHGIGLVFNIGLSPNEGELVIISNNICALLSVKCNAFSGRTFTPRGIFEIVATPPFELPDRPYHLAAFHPTLGSNLQLMAINAKLALNFDCCAFFEGPRERIGQFDISACRYAFQLDRNNKSYAFLVDEIATYLHNLNVSTAVFFDGGWNEIATCLLEDFNHLRVEFILSPIATWSPMMALQLLKIGNLVERFRDRVGIIHPPALVGYFPEFCTVRTYSFPHPTKVISPRNDNSRTIVQIIIDRNPENEFYMGHMAAVAKIIQANGISIDEISVIDAQPSQDRLFESFGLNHLLRHYNKIDLLTARPDMEIVYLNPFPFGENIDNIRIALRHGWHTVISPYESCLLGCEKDENILVIPYWEDSEVIAKNLINSIFYKGKLAMKNLRL